MEIGKTNFDGFFKAVSYAVALCGLFSLFVSGGIGVLVTALFILTVIFAWFIEDSRWQISERIGISLILVAIPFFYIDWKYQIFGAVGTGLLAAGSLARLILFLGAVKLLQKKSDKDWIFIYLISFFEVLLAAALSISPMYLASLVLFLLTATCAIILFEIRKTIREVSTKTTLNINSQNSDGEKFPVKRLPVTAVALLISITVFALPMFFAFPRVGGAGLGNMASGNRITGFSDSVKLGEIGNLLQNDEIVMRVGFEEKQAESFTNLRWRGVALDKFDNRNWIKSQIGAPERFAKTESGFYIIDYPVENKNLLKYTVYLEPLETSVLFTLARPVVISRGNFAELRKDSEDSIKVNRTGFERTAYTVISDVSLPAVDKLKNDNSAYSPEFSRYLQLPVELDRRIVELSRQITDGKADRFDKAKAIETHLQNNFGYTLELKAGGEQPLADFLFNVREGHCEYFSTAMAVMLRTQGIAARVVNGFQTGEYNETAGVYVVRQKDAHSWVEVYFPKENAWIPFDPTPFAGQRNSVAASTGILGNFNNYLVALETLWIQYFVAFDNHEQRSLFRSVKSGFAEYQSKSSYWLNNFQNKISVWWKEVRGDKGFEASAIAVGYAVGYTGAAIFLIVLLFLFYRKIIKLAIWQRIFGWIKQKHETTIIEFYERMQKVLASKGFVREKHQTPLEFAFALNMPEAVSITEKYNRVRFGEKDLSNDEAQEIENWLKDLETTDKLD